MDRRRMIAGAPWARATRHAFTVWLALLGLVVQLSAAGACIGGAQANGLGQGFPICHSPRVTDDRGPSDGHRTPAPHDECPCCSVHCHAPVALSPVVGVPAPVRTASLEIVTAPRVLTLAPRPHAGASPRGPPQL